jgi:hypothetical protein
VIELEIDDYLNAEETLLAYKYGIDMRYMVEHLGGSLQGITSESVLKTNDDSVQMSLEEFEAAFKDFREEGNQQM